MAVGFSVLKLSALTITRLGEVFAGSAICAYPRTMSGTANTSPSPYKSKNAPDQKAFTLVSDFSF